MCHAYIITSSRRGQTHEYASTPRLGGRMSQACCSERFGRRTPTDNHIHDRLAIASSSIPLSSTGRQTNYKTRRSTAAEEAIMSDQASTSAAPPSAAAVAGNGNSEAPLSALSTSTLGSAPKRIRHREDQIESAYELQRVSPFPLFTRLSLCNLSGASSMY